MNLTVVTPPASEPINVDQAKSWLRVTGGDEDDTIGDLIQTAREVCESQVSRSFIDTAWRLELDGFPGMASDPRRPLWTYERNSPGPLLACYFPVARVSEVSSITYLATDGTRATLDPSLYTFQAGDAARVAPAYGRSWPATRFEPGSVRIDFTAGYGADASAVPGCVKTAIRLLLAHYFENREAVSVGVGLSVAEVPLAVKSLLAAANWGPYA